MLLPLLASYFLFFVAPRPWLSFLHSLFCKMQIIKLIKGVVEENLICNLKNLQLHNTTAQLHWQDNGGQL